MFCVIGANRHDSVAFEELIDALPAVGGRRGRPRQWPGKLHAYKSYDYPRCRAHLKSFLQALHKACPIKITQLLTDKGKEFADRLLASREREPSGSHEFGIKLCLTKPRTPLTNGMVERFNGRIADVLKTHRFADVDALCGFV